MPDVCCAPCHTPDAICYALIYGDIDARFERYYAMLILRAMFVTLQRMVLFFAADGVMILFVTFADDA